MKRLQRRRGGLVRALQLTAVMLAFTLIATGCSTSGAGDAGKSPQAVTFPRKVTFVVPFAPGGGTDTWARIMAPGVGSLLPGHPNIQVENLAGGEGIPANNRFAIQDPADGSRLLVGTGSSYIPYLLGQSGVKYDFSKLIPLIANGTGSVLYASKKSGITSVQELKDSPTPLKYGAINQTGSDLGALVAFDLLKLNVKTTFGFEGRGPIGLALQRGELDIDRQTSSAYNATVEPLVAKGEVVPLMSYGILDSKGEVVRDPNYQDLPTVPEVYEQLYGEKPSGPVYDAYKTFAVAVYSFEKTLWAKPGTPKELITAFNDAVTKLTADKAFEKKRKDAMGNYPLLRGDENEKAIRDSLSVSPAVKDYVTKLLKDKYGTTID